MPPTPLRLVRTVLWVTEACRSNTYKSASNRSLCVRRSTHHPYSGMHLRVRTTQWDSLGNDVIINIHTAVTANFGFERTKQNSENKMNGKLIVVIKSEMKRKTSGLTSTLHLASQPPHGLAPIFVKRIFSQKFHYSPALEHSVWFLS
jgi:hypothetical protein